jgi:hypothetical protein
MVHRSENATLGSSCKPSVRSIYHSVGRFLGVSILQVISWAAWIRGVSEPPPSPFKRACTAGNNIRMLGALDLLYLFEMLRLLLGSFACAPSNSTDMHPSRKPYVSTSSLTAFHIPPFPRPTNQNNKNHPRHFLSFFPSAAPGGGGETVRRACSRCSSFCRVPLPEWRLTRS